MGAAVILAVSHRMCKLPRLVLLHVLSVSVRDFLSLTHTH